VKKFDCDPRDIPTIGYAARFYRLKATAPAELPANSPAKQHPWCDGRQSAEAPEPLPPPQGKTLNLHYAGRIT